MLLLYREHSHWRTNICKMRHCHQWIAFHTLNDPTQPHSKCYEKHLFWNKFTENKHEHSANHNECAEIFFNSPRHSGSNVGNKYVILYTKSRQAGGGRERRVREKQCRLFHNLSKSTFLFKEVPLVHFHSENPWQSRQKRRLKKSFCYSVTSVH